MSLFSLEGDGADDMFVNVDCIQVAPDGWAVGVSGAYFVVYGPSRVMSTGLGL